MKRNWFQISKRGFFTLAGLLLAVAIIAVLCFLAYVYSRKPSVDKETEELLSEQKINTSSYQEIVDSTKEKVQDIEKKLLDREREIEDME